MDLIGYVQRKPVTIQVYAERIAAAQESGDDAAVAMITELRDSLGDPKKLEALSKESKAVKASIDGKINGQVSAWRSYASMAINVGAFFGMFGFGALSQRIGRKPTFVLALISAYVTTVCVFLFLEDFWQVWVMVPLMGFCQLSLFAGYAIYFPELFPTRLRSTGTSFCYNVGRFVAALGPLVKTYLESGFRSVTDSPDQALRYAGVTMSTIFLLGLFVLPFLPETKGKALPE